MPSKELIALNEDARTRRQLLSGNYDPAEMRGLVVQPSSLAEESTVIDRGSYTLEMRGDQNEDGLLVYIAGGGFCFPADDRHRAFIDDMSERLGARSLLINHRLAPENPYPAAFDDTVDGVDFAFSIEGISRIYAIADSSGAALLVSALMERRDRSETQPVGCALLSPLTDLATTSLSYADNFDNDPMFGPSAVIHKAWHYLQGENPTNPRVSPFWGDLSSLCPFLLVAGSTEVMLGDTVRFAEKVIEYGGTAETIVEKEAPHVFPLYPNLPEAHQIKDKIVSFLKNATASD